MEHDITTQIVGVRQEPAKDNQSIKHIVSITGGTAADGTPYPAGDYVSFDPTLTGKAAGFQNMQADVRVEIKQVPKKQGGGVWTNYNISEVGAVGSLAPQAMPVQGGVQAQPVTQQQPAQTHPALVGEEQRRSEENRRSAMHAATEYVSAQLTAGLIVTPDAAAAALQTTCESLMGWVTSGSFSQAPAQQAAAPQTAEQVAATVPGVTVGVPFDTQQTPEPAPAA